MNKFLVALLFIASSFAGIAQSNTEKLQELQLLLDDFQNEIGNSDDVDLRKINSHIDTFEEIKKERDSLAILVEIIKMELMLTESKLRSCEFVKENSEMSTTVKSENYEKIDLEEPGKSPTIVQKGSYVIIESERTKKDVEKKLKAFRSKYPAYKLMVIQNKKQTWFHVCLEQKYAADTVGKKVYEIQKKGVKDAWWMTLD